MQFFGDKYGDLVRVVQIGGEAGQLNGFSMELCGGTHVRQTGQLGLFKIRSEGAIASGIRRIEALTGAVAFDYINEQLAEKDQLNRELEAKLLEANKALTKERSAVRAREADRLLAGEIRSALEAGTSVPSVIMALEGDGDLLQECLNSLKKRAFPGIGIFAVTEAPDKVHLGIGVAKALIKDYQAGKLLQELAPIVDGRGGGGPEMARGAGKKADQVPALIEKAKALFE